MNKAMDHKTVLYLYYISTIHHSFFANLTTESLTLPKDLETLCSTLPPPACDRLSVGDLRPTLPFLASCNAGSESLLELLSCSVGKALALLVMSGLPPAGTANGISAAWTHVKPTV